MIILLINMIILFLYNNEIKIITIHKIKTNIYCTKEEIDEENTSQSKVKKRKFIIIIN